MGARKVASYFFVAAVLAGAAVPAQTLAQPAPGSVTGHVYCADTNRPARLARVTLEPVDDLRAIRLDARGNIVPRAVPTTTVTETGADGGYRMESIAPGQYYIMAELQGYLSPIMQFDPEELRLPTENEERRFREVLQRVVVLSGETARMEFRLERGSAIEGKVVYEDGSPVTGAMVLVLRKDAKGVWTLLSDEALNRFQSAPTTDDHGRYRVAMLPPAEYTVAVQVPHVTVTVSGGTPFTSQMVSREALGGTRVYFGDAVSQAHAKSLTLNRGDEYSGADITIPMQRLHTVSGMVVAIRDGHPIDSAHISLTDAVDGSSIKETWASFGTGRFTMMFVPDGRYLLKVTNPADGMMETTPIEGTQLANAHFVPQHVYADTELPLQVGGDISGFIVTVPEPANHRP